MSEHRRELGVTSAHFVVELEVGVSAAPEDEQVILLSLGSLALGTSYGQALEHEGEPHELLHFAMSRERAARLAALLSEALR